MSKSLEKTPPLRKLTLACLGNVKQYKFGDIHPSREGWRFWTYRQRKQILKEEWCHISHWEAAMTARKTASQKNYRKHRKKHIKRAVAYHKKHRLACNISYRKWREANYPKTRWCALRVSCKSRKIPFDLEIEFFERVPARCPVFNIPISRDAINRDHRPSIDRRIGELGYVYGNVRWISHRANRIKNDATPEELQALAKFAKNPKNYADSHVSKSTPPVVRSR